MDSYLMETIGRIGIFIICAQVLIHFRPKASYDKYLKMLVSAMILMQIFTPISELFTGKGEQTLEERMMWFETELDRRLRDADGDYASELKKLEEEIGQETAAVSEESMSAEGVKELWIAPIEPVAPIEIGIGEGGETDADINEGVHR